MGRRAFFIRTFGCPQKCPWCDSAGTWHKDWVPKEVYKMDPEVLAMEARASGANIAVITGGEPTIFDLTPLTTALTRKGLQVHLETSGAYPIKGRFDWITISPKDKWAKPMLTSNLVNLASEVKLIIEAPGDFMYWDNVLFRMPEHLKIPVWLHVEWSQRENLPLLNMMSNWVKMKGDPYRIGYQLHKLFRVDLLDPRTAKAVPLGGDLKRGY